MAHTLTKNDLKNGMALTKEQARTILGADKFREGGGWGLVDGVKVYCHQGAHVDGTGGWKLHSIGGLR